MSTAVSSFLGKGRARQTSRGVLPCAQPCLQGSLCATHSGSRSLTTGLRQGGTVTSCRLKKQISYTSCRSAAPCLDRSAGCPRTFLTSSVPNSGPHDQPGREPRPRDPDRELAVLPVFSREAGGLQPTFRRRILSELGCDFSRVFGQSKRLAERGSEPTFFSRAGHVEGSCGYGAVPWIASSEAHSQFLRLFQPLQRDRNRLQGPLFR